MMNISGSSCLNLVKHLQVSNIEHRECDQQKCRIFLGLDGNNNPKAEKSIVFAKEETCSEKREKIFDSQHRSYQVRLSSENFTEGNPILWSKNGNVVGYRKRNFIKFNFLWEDNSDCRNLLLSFL